MSLWDLYDHKIGPVHRWLAHRMGGHHYIYCRGIPGHEGRALKWGRNVEPSRPRALWRIG